MSAHVHQPVMQRKGEAEYPGDFGGLPPGAASRSWQRLGQLKVRRGLVEGGSRAGLVAGPLGFHHRLIQGRIPLLHLRLAVHRLRSALKIRFSAIGMGLGWRHRLDVAGAAVGERGEAREQVALTLPCHWAPCRNLASHPTYEITKLAMR